jgi:hypothetical protein
MTELADAMRAAALALESPAQQAVVLHHLDRDDLSSALIILALPPSFYRTHDRMLLAAFIAGMAFQLD